MRSCSLASILDVMLLVGSVASGGGAAMSRPGLALPTTDPTLTSFNEHGVWYFPCLALVYLYRIAPQPMTFGPLSPCPPPEVVCGPRALGKVPFGPRKSF
jgi:hypothetical protein